MTGAGATHTHRHRNDLTQSFREEAPRSTRRGGQDGGCAAAGGSVVRQDS